MALEEKFAESLGTRVRIEKKDNGGKLMIEFFSNSDLEEILKMIQNKQNASFVAQDSVIEDDRTKEQIKEQEETPIPTIDQVTEDDDLYSIKNFSL
jgi:hypothetical protein